MALAGRGGRRWSSLRCAECVVRWGGAEGLRRVHACARGVRAAWGGWPARCARTPLALSLPRCVLQAGRRVERVEVNYSRAAKQARAVCCCVCEVEHQRCMHACTRARAACVPPPKPPHAHPHARARALAAFVPLPTPSLSLITATLLQVDVRLLKELMWEGVQASDPGGAPPSPDSVRQFQVGGWACGGGGRVGVCVSGGRGGGTTACERCTLLQHSISRTRPPTPLLPVHLCFICVLHLANEHGLVVRAVPTLDQLLISNVPAVGE